MVGAVATVWGVYLSIQYSQSNYQEDIKNRVLPFIALTPLRVKSKSSPFGISDVKKEVSIFNEYEESKIDKIYFVIKDGNIEAQTSLTKIQEEKVKNGGWHRRTNAKGEIEIVCVDLLKMPFELENVGNGVANDFRIGLNPQTVKEEEWKYTPSIPLKVGQTLYIHIYCEDGDKSEGGYILDMEYEDIYGNRYSQKNGIIIVTINDVAQATFLTGYPQRKIDKWKKR